MYTVTIDYKDKKLNKIIKLALYQGKRSTSQLEENRVIVSAKDATALRANLDGIIKALKIYEITQKFLKNE
ncbi:MAG: hypothetical protein QXD62_03655 [Candidatus Woesearchaeota archaeon]